MTVLELNEETNFISNRKETIEKNEKCLNLDWLRQNCEKIHCFGLGFIQLKLKQPDGSPRKRIHFYSKDLPITAGIEDVHNHRYGFTSEILRGVLGQKFYRIVDHEKTHVLEKESCNSLIKIEDEGRICGIKMISEHCHSAGCCYRLTSDTFHRVYSNFAITMLTLGHIVCDHAEVVRKLNQPKVCPFSVNMPENDLWDIVDSLLKVNYRYPKG